MKDRRGTEIPKDKTPYADEQKRIGRREAMKRMAKGIVLIGTLGMASIVTRTEGECAYFDHHSNTYDNYYNYYNANLFYYNAYFYYNYYDYYDYHNYYNAYSNYVNYYVNIYEFNPGFYYFDYYRERDRDSDHDRDRDRDRDHDRDRYRRNR